MMRLIPPLRLHFVSFAVLHRDYYNNGSPLERVNPNVTRVDSHYRLFMLHYFQVITVVWRLW